MKIIALTNDAQLPMMKNMLNSAFKAGMDMSLFHCYRLSDQTAAAYYNTAEFRKITMIKLKLIYNTLKKESQVMWVDNDIVFFENVLPEILSYSEMMVMQDDIWSPCTGFFIARSNPITLKLFEECIRFLEANALNSFVNDQTAFSKVYTKIPGLTLTLLNREHYPNGHVYFSEGKMKNAKILHCNYITNSHDKVKRLKDFKLWNDSDEGISKVNVEFYN